MTKIEQNFEINSKGQIIFKGQVLPVRSDIADFYKPPEIREETPKSPKTKRWYKNSFLTTQQSDDEEYQKKSKIA
jgi:hypothetical protein